MRRTLQVLFLFCLITPLSVSAQVESTAFDKQLVVGLSSFESSELDLVTRRLEDINGIRLSAYCSELNCLIIDFDSRKFNDPDRVVEAIRSMKVTATLKHNTTFDSISSDCIVMSQVSGNSEH